MTIEFEWNEGNLKHVVYDHPDRSNTVEEVESLFYDPNFEPLPDRIGKNGEQEYSKQRLAYHEIVNQRNSQQQKDS